MDEGDSRSESGDRAESSGSSSLSMKSDWSKSRPPDFSGEPGPSDTKRWTLRLTAESSGSSSLSMKSDWSKSRPPDFSGEPGPSDTKERKRTDEEQPKRSRSRALPRTAPKVGLQQLLEEHKKSLRSTHEFVTEGSEEPGEVIPLNSVYTDLDVTKKDTARNLRRNPRQTYQLVHILDSRRRY